MKTKKQTKQKGTYGYIYGSSKKTSEHFIVKINSIEYEITVAYYAITAGVIPSPTFSSHQKKRWSISYLSTYKSTLTLRIFMIQLSDLW